MTTLEELLMQKPKKANSFFLYKEEHSSYSLSKITKTYNDLSPKELEKLTERANKLNDKYNDDLKAWKKKLTDKYDYPDYPKYTSNSIKEFYGPNIMAKKSASKLLAYSIGGFAQIFAKSLIKYSKGNLDIVKCVEYAEKDPDNILKELKNTKVFDKIIQSYTNKKMKE